MQKIKLNKSPEGIELSIDGLKIENVISAYCDGDTNIITIKLKGNFAGDKDVNVTESAAKTETGGKRSKEA